MAVASKGKKINGKSVLRRGDQVAAAAERFGAPLPGHPGPDADLEIVVPRPPHWGGYHLWAEAIELWVEGEGRVHDRARWTRALAPQPNGFFEAGPWTAARLQP